MNTLDELVNKFGMAEKVATVMLETYKDKVGKQNGDFIITDITYTGTETKDIELTCITCGEVIHKEFKSGRNKWSELQRRCKCQKEIGKKYNSFVVKDTIVDGDTHFVCECELCGKIAIKPRYELGKLKCSCENTIDYESYVGEKFGRLTVVEFIRESRAYFKCLCECGNTKIIQAQNVINGTTKSCGCIANEIKQQSIANSPLYATWQGMKQRCTNPKINSYKEYGGRGIKVCDEWMNNFKLFEEWSIENGYRPNCGLTLDRIDVNKGYSPENCRYANVYVQNINQRPRRKYETNKYIIDGISKTKKEWCEEYNIWTATVDYRIKKMGMTFEEALKTEKQCEGNHQASLNLPEKNKKKLAYLNGCSSYIETNLYMAFTRLTGEYELIPQYKIGKYRVDFIVGDTNIVVECDGYDYHKTKEQLVVDCTRQRYLALLGYTIIRFSGSEINKNPDMVAEELLEIIQNMENKHENNG